MSKLASYAVAAAFLAVALAVPAFAQQQKGDVELGLNGDVLVTHSSPVEADGIVDVSLGYYLTERNLVGFESQTQIAGGSKESTYVDEFVFGHYRRLFVSKKRPTVMPYAGVYAGTEVSNEGLYGTTKKDIFASQGEGGFKFFVSKKTAFEVAYNFLYYRVPSISFQNSSASVVTFGITYDFSRKNKKQ
jgi:hypothetical protein